MTSKVDLYKSISLKETADLIMAVGQHSTVLAQGEMGIGNTSAASLLLSRLTGLDIAVCTGVPQVPVHIENFGGSREKVIQEKRALFTALKPEGTVVAIDDGSALDDDVHLRVSHHCSPRSSPAECPPSSVKSRIGSSPAKLSRPRKNAEDEPVSVTISHACATFCIQVPIVDVNAPNQRMRKSRYISAAAMRCRALDDVSGAVDPGSGSAAGGSVERRGQSPVGH